MELSFGEDGPPGVRREFRPRLNPGLRRVWRDDRSLQLGIGAEHAVVIEPIDSVTAGILTRLDGSRTEAAVLADAAASGRDPRMLADLIAALADCAVVIDAAPAAPQLPPAVPRPVRRSRSPGRRAGQASDHRAGQPWSATNRLAPDEASIALDRTPAAVFARRSGAQVIVHGSGRVGAPLAAVLAASGVGRVQVATTGRISPNDCAPGGITPADIHRPAADAAADAVLRANPQIDPSPARPDDAPDLVVLASAAPVSTELRLGLHAGAVPHLVAGVRETTGVVGPLVLPGASSCLSCADLHRADRDPTWPLVAAQLTGPGHPAAVPCELSLALLVAALAAGQVLEFLDGNRPDTVNGTVEIRHPDWRTRRRSWPIHPRCGCHDEPLRPARDQRTARTPVVVQERMAG